MPRAREFDSDEVLWRAMTIFWRQGYGATSVQDLVEGMGINRASIYNAFGDKRSLFLTAIDRYFHAVIAARLHAMETTDEPLVAVRQFFLDVIALNETEIGPLGCLLTNSAIEFPHQDEEIAALVSGELLKIETALYGALSRAQAMGELREDINTQKLASFLLNSLQGLFVMLKLLPGQERITHIVDQTLDVLELASA